jgi:hypothetical protein
VHILLEPLFMTGHHEHAGLMRSKVVQLVLYCY